MKKYMVSYTTKARGFKAEHHSCIEYASNKTEVRKHFCVSGGKIITIEEIKD